MDGVVFVADSQVERMEANLESIDNLRINLKEHGYTLEDLPFAVQYNKRDLENLVPVEELNRALNPKGVPYFEAAASNGMGVFETLKEVAKQVFMKLKQGP